jgi:hypothetical protein
MKKYISPTLIAYGSVETLTQAAGSRTSTDVLFLNGLPIQTGESIPGTNIVNQGGSRDIRFGG